MAEKIVTGTSWNMYDANTMSAKEIYGRVLKKLAEDNDKIVGVTADLEKSTNIGIFGKAFPDRMINVGIAEQNLFGVAAGLAKVGLIPFASTFAVFAALRAAEQVRTDICYQNLPVKIIATHGGVSFGQAGSTHHCTEDVAIMRSFPNMTVIIPADGAETGRAVEAALNIPGPVYIRVGRGFEPPYHKDNDFNFEVGKGEIIREGTDITIITCGIGVVQSAFASDELKRQDGLSVRVINMHTIKPIDKDIIISAVKETRRIVTIEEHNVIGGLGDAVAAVIAESGKGCSFKKIGLQDEFATVGYPEDLYSHYKLDTSGIVDSVREVMGMEFEADEDWNDEV
ncbi:MAG: transketolase C-terminal domain-containing protein [Clostridia bacterium]